MTPKIPTNVKSIIAKSNLRMTSLRIRKANTTTIMGAKLFVIEMMVRGMNLVTE